MATCAAAASGTPCARRPAFSVDGSEDARPTIISEKNTPIDSDPPAFCSVPVTPDAAPRWRAGTEFMIAVRFGAPNMPEPMPDRNEITANCQYWKSTGRARYSRNVAATSSRPIDAKARAPNRSDRMPDTGPAMRKPTVIGSM